MYCVKGIYSLTSAKNGRTKHSFNFHHLWQIEDSSSFDDDSAEEEEGEGDEKESGNLAAILFS